MTEEKLTVIDIEKMAEPLDSVIADVKDVGKLQIVSYSTGAFLADGTGQKGTVCYNVQGKSKVYALGANGVIRVSMATGFKPMIADDKLSEFIGSEHFTKLRAARRHQLSRLAKQKK